VIALAHVPVPERGPDSTFTLPERARWFLPRRVRSMICARSYSAIMPWNWTSSVSSGVSPEGALTNTTDVPARASSSISSA
jgi:hypothetical protein